MTWRSSSGSRSTASWNAAHSSSDSGLPASSATWASRPPGSVAVGVVVGPEPLGSVVAAGQVDQLPADLGRRQVVEVARRPRAGPGPGCGGAGRGRPGAGRRSPPSAGRGDSDGASARARATNRPWASAISGRGPNRRPPGADPAVRAPRWSGPIKSVLRCEPDTRSGKLTPSYGSGSGSPAHARPQASPSVIPVAREIECPPGGSALAFSTKADVGDGPMAVRFGLKVVYRKRERTWIMAREITSRRVRSRGHRLVASRCFWMSMASTARRVANSPRRSTGLRRNTRAGPRC